MRVEVINQPFRWTAGFWCRCLRGCLGWGDWALAVGGGTVRGKRSKSGNSVWGEGLEEVKEPQEERDGRDSLISTTDSSVDQQHRTTFCALKHARSSYKPTILMGGGFLADDFSRVLWKETWAVAVGGGSVGGTGIMWGEGLEKVEELQRERDGRDSPRYCR